ncbi:MAG: BlaI/MecI/CopY family transcriptional regulator [Candidatus Velthaea sp.]
MLRNRSDMARKPSRTLTEAEYRLMDVLWDRGTATVAVIHGSLGEPTIAYTTALSTLTILERKGFVKHTTAGKANVYSPVIDRDAARRNVVDFMLSRFFDNSPRALMLNLLQSEKLSVDEERHLRSMLGKAED